MGTVVISLYFASLLAGKPPPPRVTRDHEYPSAIMYPVSRLHRTMGASCDVLA